MKNLRSRVAIAGIFVLLSSVAAHAQTAPQSAPSNLLQQYAGAAAQWANVGFGYAKTLFGLLAAIEFAWLGAMLAIEGHDLQHWIAQIIKKMMTVMFFYAVLINYKIWVPAIIQSFQQVGQQASGITVNLNPSDILYTGLQISGNMLAAAMPSAGTSAAAAVASLIPGVGAALTAAGLIPALIVLIGALAVFAAYLVIMIAFIMATIESYIVLGAGVIFLGFGASRWTVPYVERYLSLAVATGVRLMVMYMIIGLGQQLGAQWIQDAQNLTLSAAGCESIFGIVAGAVTFMAVSWSVPKMISGMLSGSLSLGSSDLIAPATAGVVGAATVGAMIASGGSALAGLAGTSAATGGAGGVLSAGSAANAGASGIGAAAMSTEAATPLAVDPIAGSSSPIDTNGSTIAPPPPPPSGSNGGASVPFSSSTSTSTDSGASGSVAPIAANSGSTTVPSENSSPIPSSSAGSGTAGVVEATQGSTSADAGTLTAANPATQQTTKPTDAGQTVSDSQTGQGASGATLADSISSAGDTVSKLASHAPQDSHSASAPSINLSHGD